MLVQFKDIAIRELPPTPGAPSWQDAEDRSPETEQSSFRARQAR